MRSLRHGAASTALPTAIAPLPGASGDGRTDSPDRANVFRLRFDVGAILTFATPGTVVGETVTHERIDGTYTAVSGASGGSGTAAVPRRTPVPSADAGTRRGIISGPIQGFVRGS